MVSCRLKVAASVLLVFGQRVVEVAETFRIVQIRDADAAASDFVFIARPDAALRGADRDRGSRALPTSFPPAGGTEKSHARDC